jgi:hypothetical protein
MELIKMPSQVNTIAKNLILFREIASGSVSFATGATAATVKTVDIVTPTFPVSKYIFSVQNNGTQTTITLAVNNMRQMAGASATMLVTSISYNTAVAKDVIVEGAFGGNPSGVRLTFGLGTAATAAEIVSANYQIFEYR